MGGWITALFVTTTAAYTLAAVAHLLIMYQREWDTLTRWLTRTAWVLHTVVLGLLVVSTGRFPAYTVFEAALFTTWILVFNYLVYDVKVRNLAAGAFLIPVIFLLLITAVALPKPAPEAEGLNLPTSLVVGHALVALLAYVFFVTAFVSAAMYLLLERQLRRKALSPLYYRLPSLEALDTWGHRFIAGGVTLLSFSVLAGAIFASRLWTGEGWPIDAKILWTLLTWLLYVAYLAVRRYRGWGGRRAAWWAIWGFLGVVTNYLVINRFASELHRFGF